MWLVVDHFCVVSRKDEFWFQLFGSNIIRVFRIRSSAGGRIHSMHVRVRDIMAPLISRRIVS